MLIDGISTISASICSKRDRVAVIYDSKDASIGALSDPFSDQTGCANYSCMVVIGKATSVSMAVQLLQDQGAEARIVETKGNPVVVGGWQGNRAHPTVTIYNHLDVQPAQEPEWRQSPFAFRNEDGIYRGRGATDDKGPALTALLAARYAMDQGLPINIQFLWELEEGNRQPEFRGRACPDPRHPET